MTGQSRHQQGQQQGQGAMPFDAGPLPAPPTDAGFSVQLEEDVQVGARVAKLWVLGLEWVCSGVRACIGLLNLQDVAVLVRQEQT